MGKQTGDSLQRTLDLLVLRALQREPMHGYGIAAHILRTSDELVSIEEGSLYPALHRMERQDWISSEWGPSETGRQAKFYSLTRKGRQQLTAEEERWNRLVRGVAKVLKHA